VNDQVIGSLINSIQKSIKGLTERITILEQKLDTLEKAQVKTFGPIKKPPGVVDIYKLLKQDQEVDIKTFDQQNFQHDQ